MDTLGQTQVALLCESQAEVMDIRHLMKHVMMEIMQVGMDVALIDKLLSHDILALKMH